MPILRMFRRVRVIVDMLSGLSSRQCCVQSKLTIHRKLTNKISRPNVSGQGRTAGCWRLADEADLRWKKPRGDSKDYFSTVSRYSIYHDNRAIEHCIPLILCQPAQDAQLQRLDNLVPIQFTPRTISNSPLP